MRSTLRLAAFGVSVLVAGIATTSQAAILTSGQTSVGIPGVATGGTVVDQMSSPFEAANYTGTLTATVIAGDTSNPFGGRTFVYQLSNNAGSGNALTRLFVNGFANYVTDVSYRLGTGQVAPTTMDRVNNNTIGFNFIGQPIGMGVVGAGTSSEFLVIRTNAQSSTSVITGISNGAVTNLTTLGAFGPVTPEPTTLSAIAAGGLLLNARRRRA